jgi:hypothetical protein
MARLPRRAFLGATRSTALAAAGVLALSSIALGAVTPSVIVSAPSQFAACPDGQSVGPPPGQVFVNAEVEPWIAVNPANPNNLIGVWQQDRWTDGGSKGLTTAYSTNGGSSWTIAAPIPWSTCAGASDEAATRATDPWVSIAPNGTAHTIALALDPNGFMTSVLASRSTNGGATWSNPATLIRDDDLRFFNDKESITADSTNPNFVYAVWDRIYKPGASKGFPSQLNSFAFRGAPYLARSTDGGVTWEPARRISSNANLFTIGNQIVVLPDGTLLDFTDYGTGSGVQPANHDWKAVFRSTDHGATWTPKPILIDKVAEVAHRIPDGTFPVRAGGDDIAVDPVSGDLYAVWTDGRFNDGDHNDVVLSKSTDGGLTWSVPVKVSSNPVGVDAHTPSVDVNDSGQVAVTYYDYRNDVGGDSAATTDYWIEVSSDGGDTWSEQRLTTASFDISDAPVAPASRGYFLGDYEGLAHAGGVFTNLFVVATPDTSNRTDVLFRGATQP